MIRIALGVIGALMISLAIVLKLYMHLKSEAAYLAVERDQAVEINQANYKKFNEYRNQISRADQIIANRGLALGKLREDLEVVKSNAERDAVAGGTDYLNRDMPDFVYDGLRRALSGGDANGGGND